MILDSISEGVFTVDAEFRITTFNKAASRITGVPVEAAIGRRCCEVFRSDICETACLLAETLRTKQPMNRHGVQIIDSNGQEIPIAIATDLLRDPDTGEICGGVETFRDLTREVVLRQELESRYTFRDIVSKNHRMLSLFELMPQIATSLSTVLIQGESGTGKELFARAIHDLSTRRQGPFVAVNCSALPDTLLESELFGYRAGAFTDARTDKPGRFAAAGGGTLFLDEIGEIPPQVQVKLLRFLQERTYEPLGSNDPVAADVRILTATNSRLDERVEDGVFRRDLYYRINVIELDLPPLRDRIEDIPLLTDHFVRRFNAKTGKQLDGVSERTIHLLMRHDYPGNIRELENIIEHAFVLCREGRIQPEHLPESLNAPLNARGLDDGTPTLRRMEAWVIQDALERCDGNRQEAARRLGIHKSTLYRKIRQLNVSLPDRDGRLRNR
jgi:PAS domain S-box-containing protein